jgi:hypothetical protein
MLVVRDHGDGGLWYLVAVHYPAPLMARTAWERCEHKLDLTNGDQGVGLYRLAPNPEASTSPTGAPKNAHCVVAVTLDEATALKAQRYLRDGTAWLPEPDFADAMILRRAKIVSEHAGETGRVIIRRPEGRGGSLTPKGDMREQTGQG